MSSPESNPPKSSEVSHLCAPDPYLTEKHLAHIFEDFNSEMLRSTPSGNVFTHLVNNIRVPYMSQILQQQQVFAEQSANFERQLSSERARHVAELATQRVELEARHERQLSELAKAKEEVQIEHNAVPRWITDIQVIDGDYRLSERITELNGKSNDINFGCIGETPVWFVPRYHTQSAGAMSSISIDIQPKSDGRPDIARGTGGKSRYVTPKFDHSPCKIHTVHLLRLAQAITELPKDYDGHTGEINSGRGNHYLYLIWKTSAC